MTDDLTKRAAWLDKLGIDKTCRIVGMMRGMITLTVDHTGAHTVWFYSYPLATGDAVSIRAIYEGYRL